MRKQFLILAAGFLCLPAWASNPGEPLDCTDWVFLEPGLSCRAVEPFPCPYDSFPCEKTPLVGLARDNEGSFLALRHNGDAGPDCTGFPLFQTELIRVAEDGSSTVLAYIRDRCNGSTRDRIEDCSGATREYPECLSFDPISGGLLVKLLNSMAGSPELYPFDGQVVEISGFSSLFDVLQTYTPAASAIGFRVPYMPEGMGGADRFDSYYGNLIKPLDLAQAQPLRCGYPETGPGPETGDYLTVADTVPTPAPGHAVFFVTSASYQGETRVGRKADSTGRLSGRDPAVLPECIIER